MKHALAWIPVLIVYLLIAGAMMPSPKPATGQVYSQDGGAWLYPLISALEKRVEKLEHAERDRQKP